MTAVFFAVVELFYLFEQSKAALGLLSEIDEYKLVLCEIYGERIIVSRNSIDDETVGCYVVADQFGGRRIVVYHQNFSDGIA